MLCFTKHQAQDPGTAVVVRVSLSVIAPGLVEKRCLLCCLMSSSCPGWSTGHTSENCSLSVKLMWSICSLSVASYSQHHLKPDKVSEDPDDVISSFNYDTGSFWRSKWELMRFIGSAGWTVWGRSFRREVRTRDGRVTGEYGWATTPEGILRKVLKIICNRMFLSSLHQDNHVQGWWVWIQSEE